MYKDKIYIYWSFCNNIHKKCYIVLHFGHRYLDHSFFLSLFCFHLSHCRIAPSVTLGFTTLYLTLASFLVFCLIPLLLPAALLLLSLLITLLSLWLYGPPTLSASLYSITPFLSLSLILFPPLFDLGSLLFWFHFPSVTVKINPFLSVTASLSLIVGSLIFSLWFCFSLTTNISSPYSAFLWLQDHYFSLWFQFPPWQLNCSISLNSTFLCLNVVLFLFSLILLSTFLV